MLESYGFSGHLMPTLVMWFYRNVQSLRNHSGLNRSTILWLRPFAAIQTSFERGSIVFRDGYRLLLESSFWHHRGIFALLCLAFALVVALVLSACRTSSTLRSPMAGAVQRSRLQRCNCTRIEEESPGPSH